MKTHGQEHLDVADSYNSIGLVYDNMDDYSRALEYYLKSLAIYEKAFDEGHPTTKKIRERIERVETDLNSSKKKESFWQRLFGK